MPLPNPPGDAGGSNAGRPAGGETNGAGGNPSTSVVGGGGIPLHPSCDLNDLTVDKDTTLSLDSSCSEVTFHEIRVTNGAALLISEGVKLIGVGQSPKIKVDYSGSIKMLGTDTHKVEIRAASFATPDAHVALELTGASKLQSVRLTYGSILAAAGWSDPMEFSNVEVDNLDLSTGQPVFDCGKCFIKEMKGVSIKRYRDKPVRLWVAKFEDVGPGSLQMDRQDATIELVDIYSNFVMRDHRQIGETRLPDVGYPYILTSPYSIFAGGSYIIDPGVKLRVCAECRLSLAAEYIRIGERGKKPVEISAADGNHWGGIDVGPNTKDVHILNTVIKSTAGLTTFGCDKRAAIAFDLRNPATIELDQVTLEPKSGGFFAFDGDQPLEMHIGAHSFGTGPTVFGSDAARSIAGAEIEAFTSNIGGQLAGCR